MDVLRVGDVGRQQRGGADRVTAAMSRSEPLGRPATVGTMDVTALIIEVPQAEPLVGDVRRQFDPVSNSGIPAHITLLYPFVPADRLDPAIEATLLGICAATEPMSFSLSSLHEFSDAIFLLPEPDIELREVTGQIWQAFPEYPPYGGGGHITEPTPHLTVAQTGDPDHQRSLRPELEATFEPHLPLAVRVDRASIFVRDDSGLWHRHRALPFGDSH